MGGCCSGFGHAVQQQFNEGKAAEEAKRYRKNGAGDTTRFLRQGLEDAGLAQGRLLDIGAGIGALTFELLERGISSAVAVDASSAYLAVAREEAARRRVTDAVTFVYGDFTAVSSQLPRATVVAMDRVICCYPLYEPLLREALQHAERGMALSYPRDRWYVRAGGALENFGRRLRSNAFRTFVHPAADMERIIRASGFRLASRRETWIWCADVYVRNGDGGM